MNDRIDQDADPGSSVEDAIERDEANDDNQVKVDELLDVWEQTQENGQSIAVETLCQDHPELLNDVRERVAALQKMNKRLKSRKKDRLYADPVQIEATVDRLKFVSKGGLGEVFVGEDLELHRCVAIKFMHSRLSSDQDRRDRFALEAEVTGRLEHPGVVPLYGFGCTEDDRLFYAMRYIDGQTLDDAIDRYFAKVDHPDRNSDDESELGVEFPRLLANFVSVCKTIAYAHNRGIVHRDIKPANVMLGRFGETIVVDWGLAVPVIRDERFKVSGEETLMPSTSSNSGNSSGHGAGTPAFMSPEQASELAPTPASDIYSLGATLFKILSGKPPVNSKSVDQIRHDLIDGKLPAMREIRRDIPPTLEAITYKAMSRDAKDRYPTASDLAADVERFLADEPVTAAVDSLSVRFARMTRKHRTAAQAAALGLCVCLLVAGIAAIAMGAMANHASKLQDQNLVMSSQIVSRSLALEMSRIWQTLHAVADSPELREMVAASNTIGAGGPENITTENQAALQRWLDDQLDARAPVGIVNKLFILSRHGTHLARAPLPEESQVGEPFAYRAYFTGMYEDGPKNARGRRGDPLIWSKRTSGAHMSPAYKSTLKDDESLKVTFTVPIIGESGDRIGVLGTSVYVGEMLRDEILGTSDIWLVELRDTKVKDVNQRGVLLSHPDLQKLSDLSELPKMDSEVIERVLSRYEDASTADELLTDEIVVVHDPVRDDNVRAAIQPIVVSDFGHDDYTPSAEWAVVAAEEEH